MKGELVPEPLKVSQVLRTYFLNRNGLTQQHLADALQVSRHSVNELLNDRRSVTAPMALRLARVLGTDSHFWLNLQLERDLFDAWNDLKEEVSALQPLLKKPSENGFVRDVRSSSSDRKNAVG